jgi:rfaE bifunctional protein nucleotidyltransferase chain/domain
MIKPEKITQYTSDKILTFAAAIKKSAEIKASGKTVGMCHGGFDLLHPGQVKHFESAKKTCDILMVSVTSNRFVTSRKGEGRPIYPDSLRAYMIAKLADVDFVFISDFEKGIEAIHTIKPSFYIKGPDFIGKQTSGITAERDAISAIGGKMVYTNDPKFSTTEVIDYIQKMDRQKLLLIIDRDGTLIQNNDFPGKSSSWKNEIKLNNEVVSFLSYLQTKFSTTKIVVSNQSGVARKYFSESRVQEVNSYVQELLKKTGVRIDNWQYCPHVDLDFVKARPDIIFQKDFIKSITKRKPSRAMVDDGLQQLSLSIAEYPKLLVIGDRVEDEQLAKNLSAHFINVENKMYPDLLTAFKQSFLIL